MTALANISTGFSNSLKSNGRMCRKAFWQFFPFALVLPIAFASQIDWTQVHPWRGMLNLTILFVFSIPALNAIARRLHDAGFDGEQAYMPFAPFAILWVGYQIVLWAGYVLGTLGGSWVIVIWIIALLILAPLHIFALFVTLMITATVIGQTLVASQPGPNKHGPNPTEVTP